ncbi:MAG TPA: hypothetical protein VGK10_02400 [Prolixibacteraceae bacterium]|jgi:hypothetical protein
MKKDQSRHSTSLLNQCKDTNKSRHCTPFAEKSADNLADANTSLTGKPDTTFPETDRTGNRPKVTKSNNVVSDQIVGQIQTCGFEGTIKRILQANPILDNHSIYLKSPLTIQEQFSHPLWAIKSKETLLRDNNTCQCCKSIGDLQVFPLYDSHNLYLWDFDDDALKTVCEPCYKILKKELPKLSGQIGFKILSGDLDPLSQNSYHECRLD